MIILEIPLSQFKQQYLNSELDIKDEWETPNWILTRLGSIFRFTIDAAATKSNRKRRRYWGIEDNGLEQSWKGEVVFCNPPFTKGKYKHWIKKAADEHRDNGVESVLILPFKPETRAFHPVWDYARYLILPRRRTKFYPPDWKRGDKLSSPTFYVCVVAFTRPLMLFQLESLTKVGRIIDLHKGLFRL